MRPSSAIILATGMVTAALIVRPVLHQRQVPHAPARGLTEALPTETAVSLATLESSPAWGAIGSVIAAQPGTVPISPDMARQVIDVAHEIDASLGDRMGSLWAKDPARFVQTIEDGGDRLLALVEVRDRDPQLYDLKILELRTDINLRRDAVTLREAIAAGDTERVKRLENQLLMGIRLQLGFMLKWRLDYVCMLEDQVDVARRRLEHDTKTFEARVQERLSELKAAPESVDH